MQMATRTKAKLRGTYAPQPKAPPAAEKPREPAKPAPPLNSIKMRDSEGEELNAGLAMYGMRVPALGEFGEGGFRLDEGVIPRRWARDSATVMAVARRVAAKKEQYERASVARDESREKSREEKLERKAKLYRGMVRLDVLLSEMGDGAPSLGRAKKAIERAHMIHRKFYFSPKDVEQARKVIRELPAVAQRTGASGAGVKRSPSTAAPALDGFIRVLIKANPHRAGTAQHERMELLMSYASAPLEDFFASGGCKYKLKHALDQGWVALDAAAPGPAVPAPAESKKTARTSAKTPAKTKTRGKK